MPAKRSCLAFALGVLAFLSHGCDGWGIARPAPEEPPRVVPPGIAGTVGEHVVLTDAQPLPVRGWGLVIGLGQAGSSEVPEPLRRYLVRQLVQVGVGSPMHGTAALDPNLILHDKDTAVVSVLGQIPPAAPVGMHFDLYVESLPQSQTLSLDGGYLMGAALRLDVSTSMAKFEQIREQGKGDGHVFVNPFAEPTSQPDPGRLRAGIIPNGGVVTGPRALRLELRRPDYRLLDQIQNRINERLGENRKIAVANGPSLVELTIPPAYRDDYVHFVQVAMHVSLSSGPGGDETMARQLARAVVLPTALGDDISLAWEAMGRQVLPVVRELYASEIPSAAFFALRAGLRLQDALAVEPMMRLAGQTGSPWQIPAIAELGRAKRHLQSLPTLRGLLSDPNDLVRVAAYEALLAHGTSDAVRRFEIGGEDERGKFVTDFFVDVVESDRDYAIYVTCTGPPKIVLFGRGIPVRRPIAYNPPDDMVTINADAGDEKIKVDRKIPRSGRRSDVFEVSPLVFELIRTLGSPARLGVDGKVGGLELTYSQVAGVLHALTKRGDIPAKFVLQRVPEMRRMYAPSSTGRPDMPEEGR